MERKERKKREIGEMTREKRFEKLLKLQDEILKLKDEIENFKTKINNQDDVIKYFSTIANITKEEIFIIYLDAKNKIIDFEKIGEGTLTQAILYPREIIKSCLKIGALSIILCHNHPSGDPTPSENDKKITKKLLFATKEIDITLLDHIIIGSPGKYFSFQEVGLIDNYNYEYKKIMDSLSKE